MFITARTEFSVAAKCGTNKQRSEFCEEEDGQLKVGRGVNLPFGERSTWDSAENKKSSFRDFVPIF